MILRPARTRRPLGEARTPRGFPGLLRAGRRSGRTESGMVIVEATFIYPVVFAILVFLLYVGDMFYQRSWIEAAVLRYSIEGASEIANSSLSEVSVDSGSGTGSLSPAAIQNNPYRFVVNGGTDAGNVDGIAAANAAALEGEVAGGRASFFGLAPNLESVDVDYESNLIYGNLWVRADYGFQLPVAGFLVPGGNLGVDFEASSVTTVTSMGEFVRNVDLVDDAYRAGAGAERDTFLNLATQINDFLDLLP